MSLNCRRIGWMSLIVMPSMRSRSRITASCVEPGQIATFLPFRSLMVLMPVLMPAMIAMPPLLALATIITGSPAAAPRMNAAMPWMQVSTVPVSTAFLPSVGLSNGITSTV